MSNDQSRTTEGIGQNPQPAADFPVNIHREEITYRTTEVAAEGETQEQWDKFEAHCRALHEAWRPAGCGRLPSDAVSLDGYIVRRKAKWVKYIDGQANAWWAEQGFRWIPERGGKQPRVERAA